MLPANTPRSFYRDAGRIAAFRGAAGDGTAPAGGGYHPEDWVASTTARFQAAPAGLTVLPDGRPLTDAIAADPVGWLGADHVERHGADPAILVKLLDAGERLPLHVHPDGRFAASHLASPYGKAEAWVIVDAAPDAVVHLGFSRDVGSDELAGWVARQDVGEMLASTNRIPVRRGDAVFCPAGLPHAIGAGILLVEVQEPTDFSVLLEWTGFDLDGAAVGHLGLGFDEALRCVDRAAWSEARIRGLAAARPGSTTRPGVERLLPTAADGFFTAERLRPAPDAVLDPAFSVVVVTAGGGELSTGHEILPVRAGMTLLVPFGAGTCALRGRVEAVRLLR
ncbi:class I mannose-6-phosphate isomerase [Virgisporangium ochraceum]|uniref:Mannose-6-phosphate isomerase n=1 Tax=Virgisporangium ochraceum TaxID=65505 RepID=A0A8J4A1D8_9ACTN|nr:mannose-6-phosphate isomerase [Virgisporangium ochraceum]